MTQNGTSDVDVGCFPNRGMIHRFSIPLISTSAVSADFPDYSPSRLKITFGVYLSHLHVRVTEHCARRI